MLQIQNTLTKKKEEFKPISVNQVTFYHCGATVYWTQHIGNMRAVVMADIVRRSLEYLGYTVKMVRNYTDVGHLTSDEDVGEDKIAKASKREKLDPLEIAKKYIAEFEKDTNDLNIIEPAVKPRATEHIDDIISMVKVLLEKGFAYQTELAIYFDVSKFENYNKLNRQDMSKNISKAGKGDIGDPDKKNTADFAVWFFKAGSHANALQTWKSPWGEGFPGWHIECSAMSKKHLGETIDIHMGGIEHVPVHHTNEIAQSESANGKKFVNYWLHNEHLMVDGGKMSKSEGTAYGVAEIKEKGYNPLALRYFFLSAHYRSKQNFTFEALDASATALKNLQEKVLDLKTRVSREELIDYKFVSDFKDQFTKVISDDFNTPQAMAILWEVVKSNIRDQEKLALLYDFDKVFGLGMKELKAVATKIPVGVKQLAEEREKARADKNFEESDRLRDEIKTLGYLVEDSGDEYKLKKI